MKFPFYNNDEKAYTIDDANYDCWRIIVADCDMWHKYATLCELVAECPEMKQLTKPCIVNFLNNPKADTKWLTADKWFVRVTSDGCLEIADPCICNNNWDRYVAASDWDNDPGPLDRKVKWSCSYDGLYCIDIEEAWPQTLVWRPSGPNWPFINPELPDWSCEKNPHVVMKKSGWKWVVWYECPDVSAKPQYARCVYLAWRAATSCKDRTVRYFVTRADSTSKPIDNWSRDNANSYINWDWMVWWTAEAFSKPSTYWVININMPGIYEIAFSTYVTFWQTVHSIRCWLYYDNWEWPKEINDIKYECWEYFAPGWEWTGNDPAVINRMWPDQWDPAIYTDDYKKIWWTLENTWLPFARTYVLNITTPTEIFMAVKPDMRWHDPRTIDENDKDDRYYVEVTWWDWNPYWAATTIDIARVWDSVHPSRIVPL